MMKPHYFLRSVSNVVAAAVLWLVCAQLEAAEVRPADTVIRNARVLTVDNRFTQAEAVAVQGECVLWVGSNTEAERLVGPKTRVVDAHGKTVMPGIIESHTHSSRAAVTELNGPLPVFDSIAEAQRYIRQEAAKKPPGTWIVLQRAYCTRMKDGRLPTKAELDAAAPKHPVFWNCGPVSMANSKALAMSGITSDTPDPVPGEIVKDPKTRQPTGLLRNAAQLLKVNSTVRTPTAQERFAALKKMHRLYNQLGITSIAERRCDGDTVERYRALAAAGDLTLRVNCTRDMDPVPRTLEEALHQLDTFTNAPPGKLPYGPTGVGDDWVRIGPFKVWLDGGMLIGTAFMREPWGTGATYQITDPNYRGILNVPTNILKGLFLAAAQRGWQLTAHCAGEAAMDVVLEAYDDINKQLDIRNRRFQIAHGNFTSPENLERCRRLGVAGDLQPAWLYKDGASLIQTLGPRRMEWFLPFKTWLDHGLMIAGGSDHMVKLDSMEAVNPWNPWLGIWVALTRQTERGPVHNPKERLSREQAIRFYTRNGAWLSFDESRKGSLEPGKLADLIVLDRDLLACPVDDVRSTKVVLTMVGGKVVWDAAEKE